MPVYTAEPEAMRQMASALLTRADAIDELKSAAAMAVASGFSGAEVAATLRGAEEWSRGWAAGLAERAAALDRHDAWEGVPTFTTHEMVADTVAGRTRALTAPSALVLAARDAASVSPGALARFLADRTPGEQARIAAADPGLLADAPWVALELRFAANRRLLEAVRHDLAVRLAGLRPAAGDAHALFGRYTTKVTLAVRLEEELAAVERLLEPERRLLHVDWEGDGRIAEWIGPTDARHVAILVPGMGSEKLRMDSLARLADRMVRHDPSGGDLAVVTALVYDAPDWLGSAAMGSAADEGADHLSELVATLPEDRHLTLVGHSYGSLVVARSLLGRCGDRIGDVVILGSPGLGVSHVSELPVSPDRLWVGRTAGDEIAAAVHPRTVIRMLPCLSPSPGGPFPMSPCPAPTELVHGTDPAAVEFGAQVFDASTPDDVGGLAHNRYWAVTSDRLGREVPSEALRNLLLIVTGWRDRVRLRRRRRRDSSHP